MCLGMSLVNFFTAYHRALKLTGRAKLPRAPPPPEREIKINSSLFRSCLLSQGLGRYVVHSRDERSDGRKYGIVHKKNKKKHFFFLHCAR